LLAYCATQSLLQPGSWTSWQSKHVALLPASRDNTPSDIALMVTTDALGRPPLQLYRKTTFGRQHSAFSECLYRSSFIEWAYSVTLRFSVTKLVEGNDCAMRLAAENDVGQSDSTDLSTPNSASVTDNELPASRLPTSLPTAAQLSTCYKCQPFKPSSFHFF